MNTNMVSVLKSLLDSDVKIEWHDPNNDWPYFRLLLIDESTASMLLRGIDYPDGSAKHSGDEFWTSWKDIKSIKAVKRAKGSQETKPKYKSFPVKIVVRPENDHLYFATTTSVEVMNEGSGPFVRVYQRDGSAGIDIESPEWPLVRDAIQKMLDVTQGMEADILAKKK